MVAIIIIGEIISRNHSIYLLLVAILVIQTDRIQACVKSNFRTYASYTRVAEL